MAAPLSIYHNVVFTLVRGGFLLGVAFCLFWTALGIADVTLGLHWGYSWKLLFAGPAMALGAYGGYRLVGLVEKIVVAIRG